MIREATSSDKMEILEFCKNTFSWGDYIEDVWDYWISEGNLLVVEKKTPIGICHAYFSKNQVWIEGIRINPNHRKQGFASSLVKQVELMAINKKILLSLMLIAEQNTSSLAMAKNLGYNIYQTWNFYSLLPQKNKADKIVFGKIAPNEKIPHYVKSWRWLPLDQKTISTLVGKNQILISGKDDKKTIAIIEDSEHFEKTLLVTLFAGSDYNSRNLILYLQNYGFEKNYERLQILTKEPLPKIQGLEQKISFHLMQKLLS